MKKILLLVAMGIFTINVYSQFSGQILTDENELSFSQSNDFDYIEFQTRYFTQTIGAPKLPIKIFRYVLPYDAEGITITIQNYDQKPIAGTYKVYPAQPERITDGSPLPPFVDPDPQIYNSSTPYPNVIAEIKSTDRIYGYMVV